MKELFQQFKTLWEQALLQSGDWSLTWGKLVLFFLVILVTFQGSMVAGMDVNVLPNVAGALFILPFFLLSALAGQLADKFEKSMLIRRVKLAEIGLMALASAALYFNAWIALLSLLFLMGLQSTMFGPVKFAYLPNHLKTTELTAGNALVEAGTYTAIILGLLLGGFAVAVSPGDTALLSAFLLAFAVSGYLTARRIPPTPAADPTLKVNLKLWSETANILRFARQDRSVFIAILGLSWFWFYGSAITLQMPAYTKVILNGNEAVTTVLLVAFAVGIGIGAFVCNRLSGHRIELALVPIGAIGLSVFSVDLWFAQSSPVNGDVASVGAFLGRLDNLRVLFDLAMLGAFGGIYSVPLYAFVQYRAERAFLSRVIAANNIINAIFMVGASIVCIGLLSGFGIESLPTFSIPELFAILAGLNGLFVGGLFVAEPAFFDRLRHWWCANLRYRLKSQQRPDAPKDCPVLLVTQSSRLPVRILLSEWLGQPLAITGGADPATSLTSAAAVETALKGRHAVCLLLGNAADDTGVSIADLARHTRAAVIPVAVQARSSWLPFQSARVVAGQPMAAAGITHDRLLTAVRTLASA